MAHKNQKYAKKGKIIIDRKGFFVMAKRIIFETKLEKPYFRKVEVETTFPNGWFHKPQLAIDKINDVYKIKTDTKKDPLEISTASNNEIGKKLSAFSLKNKDGKTVECLFQASKKFENGGPYLDLLETISNKAKKDKRLEKSGKLIAFVKDGREYPLFPKTAFYDYLYISVLMENKDLWNEIDNYDSFADVWFSPDKKINCQAEAVAIFKGLKDSGNLEKAMKSYDDFVNAVFLSK